MIPTRVFPALSKAPWSASHAWLALACAIPRVMAAPAVLGLVLLASVPHLDTARCPTRAMPLAMHRLRGGDEQELRDLEELRAQLAVQSDGESSTETSASWINCTRGLDPEAWVRKRLREDFERFERQQDKRRGWVEPLRGVHALQAAEKWQKSAHVVAQEEAIRVLWTKARAAGVEATRSSASDRQANAMGETKAPADPDAMATVTSETARAYWAREFENEREEQEARESEEYVGHFADRALAQAVCSGRMQEAEELVKLGASVNRWLPHDDDRMRPNALAVAAACGDAAAVARLIQLGADPNKQNPDGLTALHFAVFSGSVEVCQSLVAHGALLGTVDHCGDQPIDRAEIDGDESRSVYDWMADEMARRGIERVYGNYVNGARPVPQEEDRGDSQGTAEERQSLRVEDRREKQADAQRIQRLKREGVLPHDYDEIIMRCSRNSAQDRQWLETRFRPDVWDDEEAAQRERQRVEATQGRLSEEIARLQRLLGNDG